MTTESRLYTYHDVAEAAAHLHFWELVDGRIIEMPPPGYAHVIVVNYLWKLLTAFVDARGLGMALTSLGVVTRHSPDSLRIPDVLVISQARSEQRSIGYQLVGPELAIEVKSPSDSWRDLHEKALEYLAAGTDAVWNIDPIGRRTRVYASPSDFQDLSDTDSLRGVSILDGFSVPVQAIYAAAAPYL